MAPELLYSLLASTTMLGCWLGLRVGVVLGSAGGAAGNKSHCKLLVCASGVTHSAVLRKIHGLSLCLALCPASGSVMARITTNCLDSTGEFLATSLLCSIAYPTSTRLQHSDSARTDVSSNGHVQYILVLWHMPGLLAMALSSSLQGFQYAQ